MNSFTIDVEKGRVEVYGEVDPSTIVKEMSTFGKVPELTSYEKNKPPQHVKNANNKKNIKDDSSSDSDSDSDEDDDDHSKHVNGRSDHSHANILLRRPNGIIPPMHHQQRPHHYNMNARGNGYFPAGPLPLRPEYQNMRVPYAGNGCRDHHYFQPPMYEKPPRPPPGYGYHQRIVPPRNEYYKFLGYSYEFERAPVGSSSWQFFSDDNHETYCTIM